MINAGDYLNKSDNPRVLIKRKTFYYKVNQKLSS